MTLIARPLVPRDLPDLGALLGDGGAADAYLRHTARETGTRDMLGVRERGDLVGAALVRLGAITPARATGGPAARAIAEAVCSRSSWVSIVGPEEPGAIIAERLRRGEACFVDRVQEFMAVGDAAQLGPPEPALRQAVAGDVEPLVPLVARYRVEDGLSRDAEQAKGWVRGYVRDRVARGSVYVAESDGRIVFTGAFSFIGADGAGLGGIYTIPEARGRGIAARATASLARIALAVGPVVTLHVDQRNDLAKRCYVKAGFRPDGCYRLTFR